jgi:tetratricopeptide (TPR) repeat protein
MMTLSLAVPARADSVAADCLRLAGQVAVAHCSEALRNATSAAERAELTFARGNAYLALQQYQKAVADFTAVIEQNAASGDAYIDRGVAYHHLHQYELAIRDYDRAIALNTNLYAAYYNRALSNYRLGRFAEAWKDFDGAVKLAPDDAKALYGRGLSKAHLGGGGEADFAAAKRLDPDIADKFAREGLTP